jgi:acylphosphatase
MKSKELEICQIFRVHGKVQGVYFRKYTHQKALALGLNGWVRNRIDGTVEVLAQGSISDLKVFQEWLQKGSPQSKVVRIQIKSCLEQELLAFTVRGTL